MRNMIKLSALSAVVFFALTSCSGEKPQDKPLVYEGAMAEPQIGEQIVTITTDTVKKQ